MQNISKAVNKTCRQIKGRPACAPPPPPHTHTHTLKHTQSHTLAHTHTLRRTHAHYARTFTHISTNAAHVMTRLTVVQPIFSDIIAESKCIAGDVETERRCARIQQDQDGDVLSKARAHRSDRDLQKQNKITQHPQLDHTSPHLIHCIDTDAMGTGEASGSGESGRMLYVQVAHHGKTAVHEEHKVGRSQDEADVDIRVRPGCEVRDSGIDGSLLFRVKQAF
jgi:hypothetical protein